ncbi:PREDICTED: golgin subfamily A member 6-like protein 22 [Brassica oleracea var. oleracea]|uniref:golgin subfamily A member 6-like protein 22 n=1 Tax=Brassica oleracea var. oleracea TaxID=109376 RepID=UPI0006A6E869|nr:PREDICTED: golgin subfamily A member 6-like protein 22 [Brassica oleracea var. oleracea]
MKGYPLEDIYAALGHTKVINSVLVPTVGEEIMLARIIDEEREYHCEGSTSDTWNHWLNVKQKNIFWKELYDLDVAARVFKKKKDKEKVTFLEDSSSKSGLESLKALEERILGAMSEGFSGLKLVVETKLGDMDVKMSKFEKNQRQLRRRAKKIEEKLTSIESKKNEERNYGEDMDFGHKDGEKDKGNVEDDMEQDDEEEKQVVEKGTGSSEEENENKADKTELGTREEDEVSEEDYDTEEEAEKRRVEADALWRSILSEEAEYLEKEAEKVAKGTPTPPRGRPKRLAARKIILTPPEEFLRGPAVTDPSPIETEKGAEEMAVEAEESDEESPTEKNAEEMVEEEEAVEESPTEKNAEEMVEEEKAIEEENVEKMVEKEVVEEEAMEEEAVEAEEVEEEADKVVEKEAETVVEEEDEKYTDEEKQLWALVIYKASEEMADETNEVRRDGTSEVRTGFKLRCKQKIIMYGKPRKVTAKKRHIPSNESAPVIARTLREKRKPQWLQSPYTQVKTEDIDGPKKKRKTKAKEASGNYLCI